MDGIGDCTLGEDNPPLTRHLLRLARMPSLPQLFQIIHIRLKPSAIIGIASVAVGAAVARRIRPAASVFPRTFPSRLRPPATFVRGATPSHLDVRDSSSSRRLLLRSSSASPSSSSSRRRVRRVATTTSSSAIPIFLTGGGGWEGEDLTTNELMGSILPFLSSSLLAY